MLTKRVTIRYTKLGKDELDMLPEELAGRLSAAGHLQAGLSIYAAMENDTVIAACALRVRTARSRPGKRTGELLHLYTQEDHRGLGHTRALIRLVLEDASRQGLVCVDLDRTGDASSACRALGFQDMDGRLRFFL